MSAMSAALNVDMPAVADGASLGCDQREWIDCRLGEILPCAGDQSSLLVSAVRVASLGRGKRVRPVLAMMAAKHFGGIELAALDFGCALELIHAASLVLDDLPCMDDAALRRGQPTLHRRFGEDTAVLSAVALLNHAYGVIMADDGLTAETRLALSRLVSKAVGFEGLTSGQIRDLRDPPALRDENALTSLNHQKTGVLFVAAMTGGAMIAGADPAACISARLFAERLGLAFQLWDDLQDCISTPEALGKDVLQDTARVTFVSLWGMERTRTAIGETIEAALAALGDRTSPLATYAVNLFRTA